MFDCLKRGRLLYLVLLLTLLVACTFGGDNSGPTAEVSQVEPTLPLPTDTAAPPTAAPTTPPPTATSEPPTTEASTETPSPTVAAEIATPAATIERLPLIPVGYVADWTATNDAVGIEGQVAIISATQLRISGFVSLVAEAPGVDIRLGIGDDFSDGVAVVLKDITGDTYEGRSLTLTIPDEAFDGRAFDAIAVFCFATGDLFDSAPFDRPEG